MNRNWPVVSAQGSGIFAIIRPARFPDFREPKVAQRRQVSHEPRPGIGLAISHQQEKETW